MRSPKRVGRRPDLTEEDKNIKSTFYENQEAGEKSDL